MDVNCTLSEAVLTETALGLVPAFTDILASCAGDFEAAERECLAAGHRVLARALGCIPSSFCRHILLSNFDSRIGHADRPFISLGFPSPASTRSPSCSYCR